MFSAGRAGVDAGFKQGLKAALHSALVKEWTPVGPTEEDAMVLSSGKPTTDSGGTLELALDLGNGKGPCARVRRW